MILVVAGLDFCVVFGSVNSISNALTGTGKIGCCFDLRGWNGLLATKELALLAFMRWGAMILVTVYIVYQRLSLVAESAWYTLLNSEHRFATWCSYYSYVFERYTHTGLCPDKFWTKKLAKNYKCYKRQKIRESLFTFSQSSTKLHSIWRVFRQ